MGQFDSNDPFVSQVYFFLKKVTVTFGYLLCPIILFTILKRSLEWIRILKVTKILANVVPNYPFFQKENLFEKVDQHHFYQPILLHHPTTFQINFSSWSLDIRLRNFGSNCVQIAYFPQEISSGKIDCYYRLPTGFYLTTKFQKTS